MCNNILQQKIILRRRNQFSMLRALAMGLNDGGYNKCSETVILLKIAQVDPGLSHHPVASFADDKDYYRSPSLR